MESIAVRPTTSVASRVTIVVKVLELRSDESGVNIDAETSSVAKNDLEYRIPLLAASLLEDSYL